MKEKEKKKEKKTEVQITIVNGRLHTAAMSSSTTTSQLLPLIGFCRVARTPRGSITLNCFALSVSPPTVSADPPLQSRLQTDCFQRRRLFTSGSIKDGKREQLLDAGHHLSPGRCADDGDLDQKTQQKSQWLPRTKLLTMPASADDKTEQKNK